MIGPELFRAAGRTGLEGLVSKHRDRTVSRRSIKALDQGQEPDASGNGASDGRFRVARSLSFAVMTPSEIQEIRGNIDPYDYLRHRSIP